MGGQVLESPLMSPRGGGGVNRRFLNLIKLTAKLELPKTDTPILLERQGKTYLINLLATL
jgi:hypothetical protein